MSAKTIPRIGAQASRLRVSTPPNLPRPGEIQLKSWLAAQAESRGVTAPAIWMQIARGKYPKLKLRRVNKRVVFVQP